jgi:hypothetical protein
MAVRITDKWHNGEAMKGRGREIDMRHIRKFKEETTRNFYSIAGTLTCWMTGRMVYYVKQKVIKYYQDFRLFIRLSNGDVKCVIVLSHLKTQQKSNRCKRRKFNFTHLFIHGATARSGLRLPCYRSFTIILRHTTLSRNPLDEWSVRCRDAWQYIILTRDRHLGFRRVSKPKSQQAIGRRLTP